MYNQLVISLFEDGLIGYLILRELIKEFDNHDYHDYHDYQFL